jgi:hypothetical protein
MNSQETDIISQFIPTIISLIFTGLISVVIGIYLEKFKNRLSTIKFSIFNQPIATSSQDNYWGDIKVSHNGRDIKHISVLTFKIENTSNKDLENLKVDLSVDTNSQILGQSGFYNETNTAILLENDYFNYYKNVLERNVQNNQEANLNPNHIIPVQLKSEVDWVMKNKKFHLPVFNRRSEATFNLLVENFNGQVPIGYINIVHKSLRLELKEDSDTELGKTIIYMLIFGLIIYIISYVLLFKEYNDATIPLILTLVLGLMYSILGLGVHRFIQFIRKQLK